MRWRDRLFVLLSAWAVSRTTPHEVTYRVTCDNPGAFADVEILNESGGTTRNEVITPPWDYKQQFPGGSSLFVSARLLPGTHAIGKITVEIRVDGSVVKSSDSFGDGASAVASGSL